MHTYNLLLKSNANQTDEQNSLWDSSVTVFWLQQSYLPTVPIEAAVPASADSSRVASWRRRSVSPRSVKKQCKTELHHEQKRQNTSKKKMRTSAERLHCSRLEILWLTGVTGIELRHLGTTVPTTTAWTLWYLTRFFCVMLYMPRAGFQNGHASNWLCGTVGRAHLFDVRLICDIHIYLYIYMYIDMYIYITLYIYIYMSIYIIYIYM